MIELFEIKEIQVEQQDPKIVALMGFSVIGMAPWKNNQSFTEIALRIESEIRFKQLNQINKLFKPHEIIIHLDPVEGIFKDCNISLLFEKNNVPKAFLNFSDYLTKVDDPPETSLK